MMHNIGVHFFLLTWPKGSCEVLSLLGVQRRLSLSVNFCILIFFSETTGKIWKYNLVGIFIGWSSKKLFVLVDRNHSKKVSKRDCIMMCTSKRDCIMMCTSKMDCIMMCTSKGIVSWCARQKWIVSWCARQKGIVSWCARQKGIVSWCARQKGIVSWCAGQKGIVSWCSRQQGIASWCAWLSPLFVI